MAKQGESRLEMHGGSPLNPHVASAWLAGCRRVFGSGLRVRWLHVSGSIVQCVPWRDVAPLRQHHVSSGTWSVCLPSTCTNSLYCTAATRMAEFIVLHSGHSNGHRWQVGTRPEV